MQPEIGASAATPTQAGRAAKWLAGLFPVLAIAGVIVQYGFMWDAESGPTNLALYLMIPVLVLLLTLAVGSNWLRRAWKNPAVMVYGLAIALIFTGAVYYAAHYSLDWRFDTSERSRQVDEIETKVKGIVNNELAARGNKVPMKGEFIDLQAMGYSKCVEIKPGATQVACPYQFTFSQVGGETQVSMVNKAPWENPFEKGWGWADVLFWLAFFAGSWFAFEQFVADLPGALPQEA